MNVANQYQHKSRSPWIIFILTVVGLMLGAAIWVFSVEVVQQQATAGSRDVFYSLRFFGWSIFQTTGSMGAWPAPIRILSFGLLVVLVAFGIASIAGFSRMFRRGNHVAS